MLRRTRIPGNINGIPGPALWHDGMCVRKTWGPPVGGVWVGDGGSSSSKEPVSQNTHGWIFAEVKIFGLVVALGASAP